MHIYRWDLDRTYLETEIHSMRGLFRAAWEPASRKRTVAGAADLAKGLLADDERAKLFVLSGSPTQMRRVLSEKLALDGVRVDRIVLKDNLRNLRRGRIRALRGQVGYKLPELLYDRTQHPNEATETLFGDDAEVDAVIYAVYAELVAGRMGEDDLVALLQRERAYPDAIARALAAFRQLEHADAVEDAFIRVDRGVPVELYRKLGARVRPVFSWWQAALALFARGRLSEASTLVVAEGCGLMDRPDVLAGLAQDAVRRGLIGGEAMLSLFEDTPLDEAAPRARRAVLGLGDTIPPPAVDRPDYLAFLDALDAL